jgi:hypothetical protein
MTFYFLDIKYSKSQINLNLSKMSQMGGGGEVINCSEWTLEATSNDTDDGTQVNGSNSTNGHQLEVP